MRSVLSFFSMLALGLMIAAVFMVAPSGTGTVTNIGGFEFGGPVLDYRSVVAGLGIGLFIAVIGQISWSNVARRSGVWIGSQARRLWLVGWAAVFVAVLFYS
jgi:hypothetical protein